MQYYQRLKKSSWDLFGSEKDVGQYFPVAFQERISLELTNEVFLTHLFPSSLRMQYYQRLKKSSWDLFCSEKDVDNVFQWRIKEGSSH